MKYIVLVPDGMSDLPVAELGERTPLEVAATPAMDWLARRGECGRVQTVPQGFEPGSDVAALSILGYDPRTCYTGRSPLEAASMGIELGPDDVAFRCNLVTLARRNGDLAMVDYSGGHISSEEAAELMKTVQAHLGGDDLAFYPGKMYRHLMVWHGGPEGCRTTPPHDIMEQPIAGYLPDGAGRDRLRHLIARSADLLSSHPVNARRQAQGKAPANSIWLWGEGKAPHLQPFAQKYGLRGGVISAVDLVLGIGRHLGLRIIDVPGATGFTDTNYEGKADHALKALDELDFVYVHVEATDETGHMGDLEGKISAIEDFDRRVVQRLLEGLPRLGPHRILLLPDHATPVRLKTHCSDPVPAVIYTSTHEVKGRPAYDEHLLEGECPLAITAGHELMAHFLRLPHSSGVR